LKLEQRLKGVLMWSQIGSSRPGGGIRKVLCIRWTGSKMRSTSACSTTVSEGDSPGSRPPTLSEASTRRRSTTTNPSSRRSTLGRR